MSNIKLANWKRYLQHEHAVVKEKTMITLSYMKLQYNIIQAANWKISWNYSRRNDWFVPTINNCLLMWACSISVHAVRLSNCKMKYELLIGGIHLMHSVMVDCAKQQWWLDTHSISFYCNQPIVTIFGTCPSDRFHLVIFHC